MKAADAGALGMVFVFCGLMILTVAYADAERHPEWGRLPIGVGWSILITGATVAIAAVAWGAVT